MNPDGPSYMNPVGCLIEAGQRRFLALLVFSVLTFCFFPEWSRGEEWNRFRGPDGRGFLAGIEKAPPINEQSLVWKVPVDSGHSSPVTFRDQIFITEYAEGKFVVRAMDRESGRTNWKWKTDPVKIERGHRNGSPAASSAAVSENGLIVAYSGSFGIVVLDHQGGKMWEKILPVPVTQHGAGSSPVVAGNRIILCVDQDINSYLLCLDLQSGMEIWKTGRQGFRRGFSTPLVWKDTSGVQSVFVAGTLRGVNYSLADGAVLWSVDGLPNEVCSSPVISDNKIFVAAWTNGAGVSRLPDFAELLQTGDMDNDGKLTRNEAPQGSPARMHFPYVDADKDGFINRLEYESLCDIFRNSKNAFFALDVSRGAQVQGTKKWSYTRGLPYVPSPLISGGIAYIVRNGGMVTCLDAESGNPFFQQERLNALGDYYASPVALNDRIVFISQNGVITEISHSKSFHILSSFHLREPVFASPAISEKHIYIRSSEHLQAFSLLSR